MERKSLSVVEEMVEQFQCPGCTTGGPGLCDSYELQEDNYNGVKAYHCRNHSAGTFKMGCGAIALGLPRGFNRISKLDPIVNFFPKNEKGNYYSHTNIRLFADKCPDFDNFNVAVWAMVQDGYLYIRVYMPRVDTTQVYVVKGGSMASVPNAIDVTNLVDRMD